jgi:hypothetical protein
MKTKKMKSKRRGIKISKMTTFFLSLNWDPLPKPLLSAKGKIQLASRRKERLGGREGKETILKYFLRRRNLF